MRRRDHWSIIGAILEAIDERQATLGDAARVTGVAARANLPYDRLMGYLGELQEAGLVTRDRMPRLTPKGHEFLRQYRQWCAVVERFGLPRPASRRDAPSKESDPGAEGP